MAHFSLPHLTSAEVYPFFCPPGVLPVRSSSLLCCAHDLVPTAGGLDPLSGHLLLLHHPQHHRLWRLCGRYSTVTISTIKHTAGLLKAAALLSSAAICVVFLKNVYVSFYQHTTLCINWVFPLQIVIQTKYTLSGTASSWPHGSSSAWPGWPCLSIIPLTSWSGSTPTSNSGGAGGCRRKTLEVQSATQTRRWTRKMRSRSPQELSNVENKVEISVRWPSCRNICL